MSPPTCLFLIRHGEVDAAYHHIFGGQIDMDLSPAGLQQARVLADYLDRFSLDAVYASPMKRVRQTLAPFERPGRPAPVILPGLREVDFGDWTGLSWQAVQEKYGVSPYAWLDLLTTGTMPKAETAAQWRQRVAPCLEQILRQHPGQKVAVFCHGGVIRLLLAILLDLPLPSLVRFAVDYASVTQVHCNERGASLQLLNFTPWKAQRI